MCNKQGLLGFVLDIEFRRSPDDLATPRIGSVVTVTEGLLGSSLEIEADRRIILGLLFMCLSPGATMSTRIACRH